MAKDLRFAGLNEHLHRLLIQSIRFLSCADRKIRAHAWDGAPCDVVIADTRNHYGEYVADIAGKHGTPVLAVTSTPDATSTQQIAPTITAARLSQFVAAALAGQIEAQSGQQPALIRLATEPALRARPLDIAINRRTAHLRPSMGRTFAATDQELQSMAKHIADTGWQIERPNPKAGRLDPKAASMSLEAFHLLGAHSARGWLPLLPEQTLRLTDCPDLGSAASLEYPLLVTDALCAGEATPEAVRSRTALDPLKVRACLWAFQAAGVIEPTARTDDPSLLDGLVPPLAA